jgi:hypothetical protein
MGKITRLSGKFRLINMTAVTAAIEAKEVTPNGPIEKRSIKNPPTKAQTTPSSNVCSSPQDTATNRTSKGTNPRIENFGRIVAWITARTSMMGIDK